MSILNSKNAFSRSLPFVFLLLFISFSTNTLVVYAQSESDSVHDSTEMTSAKDESASDADAEAQDEVQQLMEERDKRYLQARLKTYLILGLFIIGIVFIIYRFVLFLKKRRKQSIGYSGGSGSTKLSFGHKMALRTLVVVPIWLGYKYFTIDRTNSFAENMIVAAVGFGLAGLIEYMLVKKK